MSFLIAAQVLVSITLLVSGISKIPARTGTIDAMTSLRIPFRRLHPLAATILPWAEIVLALAVWIPVMPLQIVLSVITLLLMSAYLVIIARALGFDETVECSCFGTLASPTVSRATLGRNIILVTLALVSVMSAAAGLTAGVVLFTPITLATTTMAMVTAIVLTALALGGIEASPSTSDSSAPAAGVGSPSPGNAGDSAALSADGDGEELDYLRQPTPFAVLEQGDGARVTLRQLTARQPALLLMLNPGCGPCERVIDQLPSWLEEIGDMVQIRSVFARPLDALSDSDRERLGGTPVHDPEQNVANVFDTRGTPSAVLLGADGMTAGGPVIGGDAVIDFVSEISEQLAEVRAMQAEEQPGTLSAEASSR